MAFIDVNSTDSSYNTAGTSNFVLNIERLPNTQFWLQTANIPSISADGMNFPTPLQAQYTVPTAGNLIWTPLVVTFLVDEQLHNWQELYNWITDMWNPDHGRVDSGRGVRDIDVMTTGSLHILNNNKNVTHEVVFHQLYPNVLGDIQLNAAGDGLEQLQCDVTFSYRNYTFTRKLNAK